MIRWIWGKLRKASPPPPPPRFAVMINGSARLTDRVLNYEDVVRLIGMRGEPSVTYYRADQIPPQGCMWPNCPPVRVKDGTRFACVHTGNA